MSTDMQVKLTQENIFSLIYENNFWGGTESRSGPGSDLQPTENLRERLQFLFNTLNIRSICDLPCGDFHWMQKLDFSNLDYIGYDIVPQIIEDNNAKYKTDNIRFEILDGTNTICPKADLVLCKDLFIHLSNSNIKQTINNFKASGSMYFLATTHYNLSYYSLNDQLTKFENPDINTDLYHQTDISNPAKQLNCHRIGHAINLTAPPFSLPEPLLLLPWNESGNHLLLWKFEDIPSFN